MSCLKLSYNIHVLTFLIKGYQGTIQNVPQLVLQAIYLWQMERLDEIAISSMIFSLASIIITIISMVTQRRILNNAGHGIVTFDVTGSMIVANATKYRIQTKRIRNQIASLLGLKNEVIEITRPNKIPNGLKMNINIHLNHIHGRDINYEQLLIKCQQSGRLAEIFKTEWHLPMIPNVSSIDFKVQESKVKLKNTVPIKVKSKPMIQKSHQYHLAQNSSVQLEPMPLVGNIGGMQTPGFAEDSSKSDPDDEHGPDTINIKAEE